MHLFLFMHLCLGAAQEPAPASRLLRFPAISGNQVVFTHGGDLWLASTEGGSARRLTSHPGLELFARFSPDGAAIAFTGQYDGDEQVYTMPVAGGSPRQLTFYPARGPLPDRWGYDNQVYGWSADGSAVLFRSLREAYGLTDGRLYLVPSAGGLPQALPMTVAGAGALSPDGTRLVYSPLFRDFRTWKRYQGGWAQDLYLSSLGEGGEPRLIASSVRSERDPMWLGELVVFNSDRSGTFNLYSFSPSSGEIVQLTHYEQWDVRWPSSDGEHRVVFEMAGTLHVLDGRTGLVADLAIGVGDDGNASRPQHISVANQIEEFDLSPNGQRALFVARGDVFSVAVEHGVTRNLTQSANAHEREAVFSPDGRWIACVSDGSGEEQVQLIAHDGSSRRTLALPLKTRLYAPRWSPDGKWLAIWDKEGTIRVISVADGNVREVSRDPYGRRQDGDWSPDSRYLAFSCSDGNGFSTLRIWDGHTQQIRVLTRSLFDAQNPRWDPAGEFLYYTSTRGFVPQICSSEWNYALDREIGLYAFALNPQVRNPFAPRNVESPLEEKGQGDAQNEIKEKEAKDKKQEKSAGQPAIQIDFTGLAARSVRLPLDFDNYGPLVPVQGGFLYSRGGPFYYGRSADVANSLHFYDLEKRESREIAADVSGWSLSHDRKTVLVSSKGQYLVHSVAGGPPAKAVSTEHLNMVRLPAEEWATIFEEVWRRFRDHFYVENMHGYDWDALAARYRQLLPHVAHRSDLNYILGEMVAELNVSHAYVSGGDAWKPKRPQAGLLGCGFSWDAQAGCYRIQGILPGHNEEPNYRSPLTEQGSRLGEGTCLLAINGQKLSAGQNPYALLRHAGAQAVELLVSDAPGASQRTTLVQPIASETSLRYLAWVEGNRRWVDEHSKGQVGYLHIPDMGAAGLYEFIKWYYPQVRKGGLIIDVRGNGGGNVSQMIINRLSRKLLGLDYSRNQAQPSTYPNVVFHGSMVCLLNETSASDGDIFPWTFRQAGLGPLIGKRSWGGIVGITDHGPLLDGGTVNVPEFGNASAEGQWVVEGHGVDPDIEVENPPLSVLQGRDMQLERGLTEVLQAMDRQPRAIPPRPAPPVKTPQPLR